MFRPSATIPAGDRLTAAANSGSASSKTSTTPPPAVAMLPTPERTVLPTARATRSSRCSALRAALFVRWSIFLWAVLRVCCFAPRCEAVVNVICTASVAPCCICSVAYSSGFRSCFCWA